jgi:hypothetical protein
MLPLIAAGIRIAAPAIGRGVANAAAGTGSRLLSSQMGNSLIQAGTTQAVTGAANALESRNQNGGN